MFHSWTTQVYSSRGQWPGFPVSPCHRCTPYVGNGLIRFTMHPGVLLTWAMAWMGRLNGSFHVGFTFSVSQHGLLKKKEQWERHPKKKIQLTPCLYSIARPNRQMPLFPMWFRPGFYFFTPIVPDDCPSEATSNLAEARAGPL